MQGKKDDINIDLLADGLRMQAKALKGFAPTGEPETSPVPDDDEIAVMSLDDRLVSRISNRLATEIASGKNMLVRELGTAAVKHIPDFSNSACEPLTVMAALEAICKLAFAARFEERLNDELDGFVERVDNMRHNVGSAMGQGDNRFFRTAEDMREVNDAMRNAADGANTGVAKYGGAIKPFTKPVEEGDE